MTEYDNYSFCNLCSGDNDYTVTDVISYSVCEVDTVCSDCGFEDSWAYGWYQSTQWLQDNDDELLNKPKIKREKVMTDKKFKYKRPKGVHHKVSMREHDKYFATRGRHYLTEVNVYVEPHQATLHYNMSLLGKLLFIFGFIFVYPLCLLVYGLKEIKGVNSDYLDLIFDKQRGAYGVDMVYKSRGGEGMSESWMKLCKMIGEVDDD